MAYHSELVAWLHLGFTSCIPTAYHQNDNYRLVISDREHDKSGHHLCLNRVEVFGKLHKPFIVVGVPWSASGEKIQVSEMVGRSAPLNSIPGNQATKKQMSPLCAT